MKHLLLTTIAAVLLVGCGESPSVDIWRPVRVGNTEAVKQAIAAGGDVNAKSGPFDESPLHRAAENGHKEIAELLIEKGAVVNALGVNGTPLDWAIFRNHTETAALLRKHGGKTGEELKAEGK